VFKYCRVAGVIPFVDENDDRVQVHLGGRRSIVSTFS
jgi:hypothetical protein